MHRKGLRRETFLSSHPDDRASPHAGGTGGVMTTRHSPEFCWIRGKIGHPLSLDEGDFYGDHLSHEDQDGLMFFRGAKANEYIAVSLLRLKTGSGL